MAFGPESGVVVTGGASGIGFATAAALLESGREVALWDIDESRLQAAKIDLEGRFAAPVMAIRVDLTNLSDLANAVAKTRATVKAIGSLVHAAGTVAPTGLAGLSPDIWDRGMAVHLRALAFATQALLPDLASQPGSAIVGVASINATLGNGLVPTYSAAKGGMISLIRSMADELAGHGIRVNAVSPGYIDTPMLRSSLDQAPPGHFERRVLLGRLGQPDEVARVIRFLLSEEASFITAAEIVVDGGTISSQRQ